jgi:ATP-dependent DNA helicase RecG
MSEVEQGESGAAESELTPVAQRNPGSGRRLRQLAKIELTRLTRIGPKRVAGLAEMGIETVLDLITHYPRRYLDRTAQQPIRQLTPGEEALVLGSIKRVESRKSRQGRTFVEAVIFDGSGYLKATFFNQGWRVKQLPVGTDVAFFGKVDLYRDERRMTNPVVDLVGNKTGKIVPLYPQSEKAGLTTWEISDWVEEALERAGQFAEPLKETWRDELDLVGRTWAMRNIHVPESMGAAQAARKRLAFDELLRMQLLLVMRKRAVERDSQGLIHPQAASAGHGPMVDQFHRSLPFPLTGAQVRAIAEISRDLASPLPMHRLLQGDVGAGKTLVAVSAALMAIQDGTQAALMAPTEVLAEQHEIGIRLMLDRAGLEVDAPDRLGGKRPVTVKLLTNRTTASERRDLHAGLLSGDVDFLIGTHALLTEIVAFKQLGLVVIDEQHRFGVEQRAVLKAKGNGFDPDMLVMTATPIPRTAAMTVYGDLDSTILDELPPGRTPIVTQWARSEMETASAFTHVVDQVAEGRQAYVVCALVEGSEKIEARSAIETFEELQGGHLHGLRLGLLHGQMPSPEKEAIMTKFRAGDLDVLVATTVIEVGVDVPNATVMVILDADRFGIAQLHQLRGRVGRGANRSYCYLVSETETPDGVARLEAIERSTDGFELAEVDLELRGEGTIMGTRQKGRSDLKLASLRKDKAMVAQARQVATAIVDADPDLSENTELRDEIQLFVDPEEAEFLFKS